MTDYIFNREKITCFRFVNCHFSAESGIINLVYAFDNGPCLTETLVLPGAPFYLDPLRTAALQRALQLLHLIAGVSYYKAALPRKINIENYAIDQPMATLVETIYEKGLGEFSYRNKLNMQGRFRLPVKAKQSMYIPPPVLALKHHALTAIGGGKDSLVSIQALQKANLSQTLTWIGNSTLIQACTERTGLPQFNIQRTLAKELFAINQQGAWNGHIPVTAINSAIMLLAAIALGYDQIVFSNERSANYGSQIKGIGEVNHQWSKSWEFENQFSEYIQTYIVPNLHYYSLLRPLSELAIARQFAKNTYFDNYFSSCNRNFHILGKRPQQRWCGLCPKCHFVFLILAPFMHKQRLINIFGRNLLDDITLAKDFDALLEFDDQHKPFECVGEGRESRAALTTLAHCPQWKNDALVKRFNQIILPNLNPNELALEPLLGLDHQHRIPKALWECVRADFTA